MTAQRLEIWANEILNRVEGKKQHEDSRVELKRIWYPPEYKCARILAAHANAARTEPIMWLVGVDEVHGVIGVNAKDLANWYPALRKHFEGGVAPNLDRDIAFNRSGQTVVAMLFTTDRPPYVVTRSVSGEVFNEVPWRQGTRARPATRSEILLTMIPSSALPEIDPVEASVTVSDPRSENNVRIRHVGFIANIYFAPKDSNLIAFPLHKMKAVIRDQSGPRLVLQEIKLDANCVSVTADASGLSVSGPGSMQISGNVRIPEEKWSRPPRSVILGISMICATQPMPLNLDMELRHAGTQNGVEYFGWGSNIPPEMTKAPKLFEE